MKLRWFPWIVLAAVTGTTWSYPQGLLFQRGFLESLTGDYRFSARIGNTRVYCRNNGISIVSVRTKGDSVVQQRFDIDFSTSPTAIVPTAERPEIYTIVHGHSNYRVRSFEEIRYIGIAPGIDAIFRWTPSALKYDVVAYSAANLDKLHMLLRGATVVAHDAASGTLTIGSGKERFHDQTPIAYQTDGTKQYPVSVTYAVLNDSTFTYRIVGTYNPALPLVVDPAIVWSSYLGGSQEDAANDITTDSHGNIYVAGNSLSLDFPLRGTTTNRGRQNIVVAQFTADGQHRWSTYFGGERDEVAKAIVTDGTTIYVGGWSSSPSVMLDQPYPQRAGGVFDAIILAFTTNGTYVRGTFLGGSREELVNALALRRDGSLIAVGRTNSRDFPIAQALQPTLAGDNDVFITALSLPSLQLLWSTYYGGSGFDEAYGVSTDRSGSVYVTGVTISSDFPTANAFQPRAPALDNAFVLALNASGQRIWSSYLGGSDYDLGNRIVWWNDKLYIVGTTSSEDFPIIGTNIAQPTKSGYNDAFIACMTVAGIPTWSTFWGGRMAESGFGVAVLPNGKVLVAGSTYSADFPRRRSLLWSPRGGDDVFVALFHEGQNEWSLTFGGSEDDILAAIALLPNGDVVGAGETRSRDLEPLINAQYQANTAASNRSDCFLFRLCTFAPSIRASSPRLVICQGQTLDLWAHDSTEIVSIRWNTGSNQQRLTVTAAGEYWFTATSPSGCTVQSDTVRIASAPVAPVQLDTISPRRSLRICEGERIGLVVRGQYRSHAWFDDYNGLITTDDTLWITSSGSYYAIVEDSNGCTSRSPSHQVVVIPRPALAYRRILPDGSAIAIQADTISPCRGETITLEIERPAAATCRWSDGIDQCRRTITADQQLSAVVTDTAGCTWQLPPLTIQFVPRSLPQLSALDTTCVGTPFELQALGDVRLLRWEIPPSLQILAVSRDSSTWRLIALTEGVYRVRAWHTNPCSDTASRTIVVLPLPRVNIQASREFICPGEQSILTAPSGYAIYRWNDSLGSSTWVVRDSGWYRLMVVTSEGCTATDSVYIGRRQPVTVTTTVLQFGVVEVGQTVSLNFVISNPADTVALLTYAIVRGQVFRIARPATLSQSLLPLSYDTVTISFTPESAGDSRDTLTIIQQLPCVDTLRVILEGRGIQPDLPLLLEFAIEAITISPLDDTVRIPLYCWRTSAQTQRIDSLILTITYNPTMLLPRSIEPGMLTLLPQQNERGYVTVTVPLDSIPTTPHTIPVAVLIATALLGDREEDRNEIISASVLPPMPLAYEPAAGAVRYQNLCRVGGVRLLGQRRGQLLQIFPNPSDGVPSISVVSPENGTLSLAIFTLEGRMCWHRSWHTKAGQLSTLTPLALPPGVYIARVQTPSGITAVERFMVVR